MTSARFTSKPLFTRRQLVALLLPLVAEQALSVTIGLADTLMVSSVGEAAVSGVSLVDTFNTLMIRIDERPGHRRCGGGQPVHRPPGAEERQGRCRPDPVGGQCGEHCGGSRGAVRPPPDPAGRVRSH